MEFDTNKQFYDDNFIKTWQKDQTSSDYKLIYSYIPSVLDEADNQDNLIDWKFSSSELTSIKKGLISFRVCDMGQIFILHLDTKVLDGIHNKLIGQLHKILKNA
jgi:hypothetical protein